MTFYLTFKCKHVRLAFVSSFVLFFYLTLERSHACLFALTTCEEQHRDLQKNIVKT